jgi:hypothetical protein
MHGTFVILCNGTHRDYYIFTALKAGDSLMTEAGIEGKHVSWQRDMQLFSRLAPPMMAMRLCFFQRFVLVLFAPSIP